MNKQSEDIRAIREMMEKSSKFLSLSGISGVIAGIAATLGAAFAYYYVLREGEVTEYVADRELFILFGVALVVLVISVGCGLYFSWKKAKKNGQQLLSPVTRRTLYNLGIPLVAGGLFALIFLLRGDVGMVICGTLLFYGLALVNVSKYTYDEIHYLGLTEIALGLLAAVFMREGILFWAIGFGACHIVYGLVMYVKYDVKKG